MRFGSSTLILPFELAVYIDNQQLQIGVVSLESLVEDISNVVDEVAVGILLSLLQNIAVGVGDADSVIILAGVNNQNLGVGSYIQLVAVNSDELSVGSLVSTNCNVGLARSGVRNVLDLAVAVVNILDVLVAVNGGVADNGTLCTIGSSAVLLKYGQVLRTIPDGVGDVAVSLLNSISGDVSVVVVRLAVYAAQLVRSLDSSNTNTIQTVGLLGEDGLSANSGINASGQVVELLAGDGLRRTIGGINDDYCIISNLLASDGGSIQVNCLRTSLGVVNTPQLSLVAVVLLTNSRAIVSGGLQLFQLSLGIGTRILVSTAQLSVLASNAVLSIGVDGYGLNSTIEVTQLNLVAVQSGAAAVADYYCNVSRQTAIAVVGISVQDNAVVNVCLNGIAYGKLRYGSL